MSKTKILNDVIVTSVAMNYMCAELAKCICPKQSEVGRHHITDGAPAVKSKGK